MCAETNCAHDSTKPIARASQKNRSLRVGRTTTQQSLLQCFLHRRQGYQYCSVVRGGEEDRISNDGMGFLFVVAGLGTVAPQNDAAMCGDLSCINGFAKAFVLGLEIRHHVGEGVGPPAARACSPCAHLAGRSCCAPGGDQHRQGGAACGRCGRRSFRP